MLGRGRDISNVPLDRHSLHFLAWVFLALVCAGCGSTKSRTATEQLIMSDALDRAISQIDFQELAGQTVYFETKYLVNTKDPMFIGNQKGLGFVNAEYVQSSLRQQMTAAGLKLQDKAEEADYVVEARLGAIGYDNNEVLYGIPASNPFAVASALVPSVPAVPAIPELAIAKKVLNVGAAKVGVFAYDRKTREAVWQAGISQAASDARDMWVLGVGPFQQGTIYKGGTAFAGARLRVPDMTPLPPLEDEVARGDQMHPADVHEYDGDPLERFSESRTFRHLHGDADDEGAVKPAAFVEPTGKAAPLQLPAVTPLPPKSGAAAATPAPSPTGAPSAGATAGTPNTNPANANTSVPNTNTSTSPSSGAASVPGASPAPKPSS